MPSDGRRLHGFTVVSDALALARQLIVPAILGGAWSGGDLFEMLQWIAVILAVPSLGLAVLRWLKFRFRLAGDELIIDSGVLSRRRRVIPLGRIQNIDLRQSLLQRLAGVAEIKMETASGGAETEATLAVLSLPEAGDLQQELMRRRGEARAGPPDPSTASAAADGPDAASDPSRRVLRLSVGDLAIAGATSNEAGLIAAGLATGLQLLGDVGGLDRVGAWIDATITPGASIGLMAGLIVGLVLTVGFIVAGWVVSVFASIVRYHGFTLTRVGDDIRREFGLLSRHHSTVPLERVQAVRIEETILRRPFGLVALKIETAGAGPQQAERGETEAFVPIARKHQVGQLLREVFPSARFENVTMHTVSPLSRRRSFVRLATPIVLIAASLAYLFGSEWLVLAGLLIPAALYARADYRARGWARPQRFVLVRGGVFTRVNWVVPEEKVQTLHLRDTPFQRRLGLRTLLVDTAAGGRVAKVVDLEDSTAEALLHDLAVDAEAARRESLPRRYSPV